MVVPDAEAVMAQAHRKVTPLPADPWDAPYFGGPVYLAYRPAPMPAPAQAPKSQGLAADPWDAPYFGGPVYFRYPDYPVGIAAPGAAEVPAHPGESMRDDAVASTETVVAAPDGTAEVVEETAPAPAITGRRGGWLARLFGW